MHTSIITVVIMGVSGSGKSTVGRILAGYTGIPFADADDFHPPKNRQKMASGEPLDDEDRMPWLHSLCDHIRCVNQRGDRLILACSALKTAYRNILRQAGDGIAFVYLEGSRETLLVRLESRPGHFFPAKLLDSQLEILEPPDEALKLGIDLPPHDIAEIIRTEFFKKQSTAE